MKQAFNNLLDCFVLSPLIWLFDTMCPVQDFLIWLCCTLSHYLICLYIDAEKILTIFILLQPCTEKNGTDLIFICMIPLIRSHLWVELMH